MKKRIISITIVATILITSTVAYAANVKTINATLSSMKLYFNNKQINGDVYTAKGTSYIPLNVLNNSLGMGVSANAKTGKISITGSSATETAVSELKSKVNDLQEKYDLLQSDASKGTLSNKELQKSYDSLNDDYKDVKSKYDTLFKEKQDVDGKYTTLNSDYTDVKSKYEALQKDKQDVDAKYKTLSSDYTNLTNGYNDLQKQNDKAAQESRTATNTYNELKDKYIKIDSQVTELNNKLKEYVGATTQLANTTDAQYINILESATKMSTAALPFKMNQFVKTYRNNTNSTYYKISLKEGEGFVATLFPQIDKGSMSLYLYNSNGDNLSGDDYVYNSEYGYASYKAKVNCDVYVRVTGSSGLYYLGLYNSYWNNINSLNDERDHFGHIFLSKRITGGLVTRNNDNKSDWYRVLVKEGQTLSASITCQQDKSHMSLYLIDGDGSTLSGDDYVYNGETATVSKKAYVEKIYYIKVTGTTGKYTLNYTLN